MSSAPNQPSDKKLVTVRVDAEVYRQVKEYAKRTDTTVSRLIRQFFLHLLEETGGFDKDVEH